MKDLKHLILDLTTIQTRFDELDQEPPLSTNDLGILDTYIFLLLRHTARLRLTPLEPKKPATPLPSPIHTTLVCPPTKET